MSVLLSARGKDVSVYMVLANTHVLRLVAAAANVKDGGLS